MSALDDLFSANSPTPPSPGIPSPSGTPGPSRRRGGEALFLDGASTPSQTPVKRRYADFADDEEPPLSPIGGEYLERRRNNYGHLHVDISAAEAENVGEGGGDDAVDVSTVAPRAIAELFDDPLAVQDPLALGGTAEEEPKPRRVMAKVDAERLLGPKGLPALMVAARKFKSKGKGHEASDLRRLMDVYQLWAHSMFPKGDFSYTVQRVEAVCRKRLMESAISGLHDQFRPPASPPRDDHEASRSGSPSAGGNAGQTGNGESLDAFIERDEETLPDETYRYAPGAETLAQDRRRGGLFADEPDMPDEDELLAMREMESMAETGESTAAETRPVDFGDEAPAFDEEEEW